MKTLACRPQTCLYAAGLLTGAMLMLAFPDAAVAEPVMDGGQLPVAEESKGGFPQLDARTYPSQIFWLIVSFSVLYLLMSRVALPRITEVIDLRQTQREGNLNRAQTLQEEAEEIRKELDLSMAKAQAAAQDKIAAAEQALSAKATAENSRFGDQARTRIAAAEQNIARAKKEALASLADISADAAIDIVQKIAAVSVTKADAKKAVSEAMEGK